MNAGTTNRTWWVQGVHTLRALPVDLVAALGLLIALNVVAYVPAFQDATIGQARVQTMIAIPTLLFVPGYVLVGALFPAEPGRDADRNRERTTASTTSISLVERTALSFGMSVAIVPIFAVLAGSLWGFSRPVVLTVLSAVILAGIVSTAVRRLRLPPEERYRLPAREWVTGLRGWLRHPGATPVSVGNLVLLIAVLAAVGAMGYAVATPYQSAGTASLYLVTENESGVEVASGYPTEFTAGDPQPLTVGIRNDGGDAQSYTVVIVEEQVRATGEEFAVTEANEIGRLHGVASPGETLTRTHSVDPQLVGEDIRLHYYLYRGESAPANPDPSSAYRDVYIWINVTES